MHPESVIQFSKEHFMTGNQGHRTFSLDELTDLLHESIENDGETDTISSEVSLLDDIRQSLLNQSED